MKKIPTMFVRDPRDRQYVVNVVPPECQWVADGEGFATAKWDGTCILIDASGSYARREVKYGKEAPDGFMEIDYVQVTGKRMGWEPITQTGWIKFFTEAWEEGYPEVDPAYGTYELCGPKINGNPHGFDRHVLIQHGTYRNDRAPRTYEGLREWLEEQDFIEGIVWHHPDGRRAKIKRRDLGLPWPAS